MLIVFQQFFTFLTYLLEFLKKKNFFIRINKKKLFIGTSHMNQPSHTNLYTNYLEEHKEVGVRELSGVL